MREMRFELSEHIWVIFHDEKRHKNFWHLLTCHHSEVLNPFTSISVENICIFFIIKNNLYVFTQFESHFSHLYLPYVQWLSKIKEITKENKNLLVKILLLKAVWQLLKSKDSLWFFFFPYHAKLPFYSLLTKDLKLQWHMST